MQLLLRYLKEEMYDSNNNIKSNKALQSINKTFSSYMHEFIQHQWYVENTDMVLLFIL